EWDPVAGNDQGGEVRVRPAAGEQTGRLLRIAEELLEPIEHDDLDLGGAGGFLPHAGEQVGPRCQAIAEDRRRRWRARDKRQKARMAGAIRMAEDLGAKI